MPLVFGRSILGFAVVADDGVVAAVDMFVVVEHT